MGDICLYFTYFCVCYLYVDDNAETMSEYSCAELLLSCIQKHSMVSLLLNDGKQFALFFALMLSFLIIIAIFGSADSTPSYQEPHDMSS